MQIRKFLKKFLTGSNGAFYTSQDADLIDGEHSANFFALDDAGRRKLGIPRIDQHQYARENGWVIAALCNFTEDPTARSDAITAAEWVIANRSLPGGGFRHDTSNPADPYLGDSLAMGQAFLASTPPRLIQRGWTGQAAAEFIAAHFVLPVGVATSESNPVQALPPTAEVDENIAVVRFANLLFYCSGKKSQRALADHAMQFVASPQVAISRGYAVGGMLLADREMATEPMHLAVVGAATDPRTSALLAAGRNYFNTYKRIDLVDRTAGKLPINSDLQYPELKDPAAFLCANGTCSSPIQDVAKLQTALASQSH